MFQGIPVSVEQAIQIMHANDFVDPDTGVALPFFDSEEQATQAGRRESSVILTEEEADRFIPLRRDPAGQMIRRLQGR